MAEVLLVIAPCGVLTDDVDVAVECDETVAVCCIVLFADAAEDALLKLEPLPSDV